MTGKVERGKVTIEYEVLGRGSLPIILIAGFGQDRTPWNLLTPYLEHNFKVVIFDNRGFGMSTVDESYTIRDMAEDVISIADKLKLKKFFLLGYSLGAFVAFDLCCIAQNRIMKLIILSGPYPGSSMLSRVKDFFTLFLSGMSYDSNLTYPERAIILSTTDSYFYNNKIDVNELIAHYYSKNFNQTIIDTLKKYIYQLKAGIFYIKKNLELIENIKCDSCLIYGYNDKVIYPYNGYFISRMLRRSKLHIINDCGHLPQREDPERVANIIIDFIFESKFRIFKHPIFYRIFNFFSSKMSSWLYNFERTKQSNSND